MDNLNNLIRKNGRKEGGGKGENEETKRNEEKKETKGNEEKKGTKRIKKRKGATEKKDSPNKKMIIIVIIVIVVLLLIGGGIGIYLYMSKSSSSIVQEENKERQFKILEVPSFFYKNTVPMCDLSSCLKLGETILLNQLLKSSSSINNIIIKKTLNEEERSGMQEIYGEETVYSEDCPQKVITNYLLFYNTYANVYKYINIYKNTAKLLANGLLCCDKLIKFIGYKCTINNITYYCDLTYLSSKKYVLLCNSAALPIGIISLNDYLYLKNTNNIKTYILTDISFILLTNYSILVFSSDIKLIGIISIL
jgi:hypothetical protein